MQFVLQDREDQLVSLRLVTKIVRDCARNHDNVVGIYGESSVVSRQSSVVRVPGLSSHILTRHPIDRLSWYQIW